MKRRKKLEEGYVYRMRCKTPEDYVSVPYKTVIEAMDAGFEIGDYLRKNFIFTITKSKGMLWKTREKQMVVLRSNDAVFEMEQPIYDRYKEEIEQILNQNMNEAVRKYIAEGKTKIVVNFYTSGCEYELENEGSFINDRISGLKELYISYTKASDIKLLKDIIFDTLKDEKPSFRFLDSDNILLQAGQRSLLFNARAYNLMIEVIKEHENKLNKNGSPKVMNKKLED